MSDLRATLFVGNLSVFCNEKDVESVFAPYGPIIEIRLAKSDDQSKHLSYCFIKFSSQESAAQALIELNGVVVCGRPLKVGRALSRTNKGGHGMFDDMDWGLLPSSSTSLAPTGSTHQFKTASVHVTFISHQLQNIVNEESLRHLFSQFGEVYDAVISKSNIDQYQSRQSGYGFIHFPGTPQGMAASFAAAEALSDILIDDINYKCKISHHMEKQLRQYTDNSGTQQTQQGPMRPFLSSPSSSAPQPYRSLGNHATGSSVSAPPHQPMSGPLRKQLPLHQSAMAGATGAASFGSYISPTINGRKTMNRPDIPAAAASASGRFSGHGFGQGPQGHGYGHGHVHVHGNNYGYTGDTIEFPWAGARQQQRLQPQRGPTSMPYNISSGIHDQPSPSSHWAERDARESSLFQFEGKYAHLHSHSHAHANMQPPLLDASSGSPPSLKSQSHFSGNTTASSPLSSFSSTEHLTDASLSLSRRGSRQFQPVLSGIGAGESLSRSDIFPGFGGDSSRAPRVQFSGADRGEYPSEFASLGLLNEDSFTNNANINFLSSFLDNYNAEG